MGFIFWPGVWKNVVGAVGAYKHIKPCFKNGTVEMAATLSMATSSSTTEIKITEGDATNTIIANNTITTVCSNCSSQAATTSSVSPVSAAGSKR